MTISVLLNDLSLEGCPDLSVLQAALISLSHARLKYVNLKGTLQCSRQLVSMHALHGEPLIRTLARFPKEERGIILAWLANDGPYSEDSREDVENDLFFLFEREVTDLGPGEAARRRICHLDARLFSLCSHPNSKFGENPLSIQQGFSEEPLDVVAVPNIIDIGELIALADSLDPAPQNWAELLDVCRRRFTGLRIGPHCDEVLKPLTFYPNVARRVIELLTVLNDILGCFETDGSLTEEGEAMRQKYFVGRKAWFSDESGPNKLTFAAEMTFPHPGSPEISIQCFWHGKIKIQQFRIHFEWPVRPGSTKLNVTYIGPKISKT